MPPIGDVHITKDLPVGQFIAVVKELFRVVDALSILLIKNKKKSAKHLPRPGLGDITSTISNMKCVVDNQ